MLNRINGVWKYAYKISGFDISSRHMEIINEREILISHEYKGVYHLTLSEDRTVAEKVDLLDIRRGRHASLAKLDQTIFYLSPDGMFRFDKQAEDFYLLRFLQKCLQMTLI